MVCYTDVMELARFYGKRICVAISGGVDSVALLHYLKSCQKDAGFILSAVHCEHGIRGEDSLADARFVAELCLSLDVPLHSFHEDCPARAAREKESLETAARNFRHERFAALIAENKADYIATAHHLNDEAETVLFRLARGTLSGVRGMAEECGYLIRPFLSWTRAEIENYAKENGLSFCVDKTNADLEYARNKIRAEVLPKLEETFHGATKNIARFATLCGEDDDLLYEYAKNLLVEENGGYRVAFNDKKPLFRRACLLALKGLGVEKDYTSTHLEDGYKLQGLERGAKMHFPKGVVAKRVENGVFFYRERMEKFPQKSQPQKYAGKGFDGGRYEVIIAKEPLKGENEWKVLRFDPAKLPTDMIFRFREDGDKIDSFGGGKKTLKKFLNEKKIPVEEREYLPLLAKADTNEVYIVCGVEISQKIKVDENGGDVLYIAIRRKESKS